MSDVSCAVLMPLAFAKKASGITGILIIEEVCFV